MDVQRIATDVAQQQHAGIDVIGVTRRVESSSSAEVLFAFRDCEAEPNRVLVGVSRDTSASECRGAVWARLREHLTTRRSSLYRRSISED